MSGAIEGERESDMSPNNDGWKQYFDRKAEVHGASVKSSDYFDDASFFIQRDNILRWLGELRGAVILDAGCGVGAFSEPLVKDNTVHGVDFSEKSLEYAAARGLRTSPGDLTALAFPDGMFDLVLCIGVIQLVDRCEAVLAELARVTRPGGTVLVQTLHRGSVQRRILGLFERNRKFDRMYGMEELSAVFHRHGLGRVEFLKQYHPFKCVKAGVASSPTDLLCTSFAIRGVRA